MRKASPSQQVDRVRWRGAVLLGLFALGAAALESRILYLQLINKEFLAAQANDRHLRMVEISAHRGSLTDRDGEPLAVSTPVDTIVARRARGRDGAGRGLARAQGHEQPRPRVRLSAAPTVAREGRADHGARLAGREHDA